MICKLVSEFLHLVQVGFAECIRRSREMSQSPECGSASGFIGEIRRGIRSLLCSVCAQFVVAVACLTNRCLYTEMSVATFFEPVIFVGWQIRLFLPVLKRQST